MKYPVQSEFTSKLMDAARTAVQEGELSETDETQILDLLERIEQSILNASNAQEQLMAMINRRTDLRVNAELRRLQLIYSDPCPF